LFVRHENASPRPSAKAAWPLRPCTMLSPLSRDSGQSLIMIDEIMRQKK
jgi:hypothetical protein